ncbi:hypothetical protein [Oceanisphaera sp. IT1-181]|uniref:hypothetical protein n=1 Tax=Oceanisphaera sp. IT1-181 TaxID=3081199 RepID=UPI0029CA3062|nr:hypothetical protein [Oceanisphaera sp. IT1-181]
MTHITNPKRLFATLLVAATVSISALPAQAQAQTQTQTQTLSQQVSSTSLVSKGNEASHGDGVDHRQCKQLRRAGTPLPGYCF